MRSKALLLTASTALLGVMTATALADDGERLFKTISTAPGQLGSPEPEGEHAFTQLMNFYVPAQASDGTLLTDGIPYVNTDGTTVKTEPNAKPLIAFFIYGPVITFDEPSTSGFPGHGRRDAYAAVSLDDGSTRKRTNLSESADKSSFTTSTYIQDPAVPPPEFVVTSETPITTSALYNASKQTLTISGTSAVSKSTVEIPRPPCSRFVWRWWPSTSMRWSWPRCAPLTQPRRSTTPSRSTTWPARSPPP